MGAGSGNKRYEESYSSAFLITDDVPGVGFSFQFKAGNKSSDVKSYWCIIISILLVTTAKIILEMSRKLLNN